VENLKYLSSEQALADLAQFRDYIHSSFGLSQFNKWVSFGGSYPGQLSALFRLKYPHLVHAAVSSSAPMLAIVNFTDYMVVVNQSLNSYHVECTKQISLATQQIQSLMNSQSGRTTLQQMFKYLKIKEFYISEKKILKQTNIFSNLSFKTMRLHTDSR
jgi:hypothetical protein